MLLNLTLNPQDFFGDEAIVVEYKREDAWDMLAMFWSDTVCDYIALSKKIADLAHESGIKKAVIDVPAYSVSILETELLLRDIIPVHYYSGQFVETKSEVLLENLYNILERQTDADHDKVDESPVKIEEEEPAEEAALDEPAVVEAAETIEAIEKVPDPVFEPLQEEEEKEPVETKVVENVVQEQPKKTLKIPRAHPFGHNVNLHFNPTIKERA